MDATAPAPDLLADLLLRFYREPLRYRQQMHQVEHGISDRGLVLRLAAGQRVELTDPVLLAQGHQRVQEDLRAAAVFHIQQVFFRPDATHYQVLGLTPGASTDAIREHFRMLMLLIHPDRQDEEGVWPESFAARANAAYAVLKNPESRRDYDRELESRPATAPATRPAGRGFARRPTPVQPLLPEWMTAGVGSFIRAHPGVTAFGGLMLAMAIVLGAVMHSNRQSVLTRDGIGFPAEPMPEVRVAASAPTANTAARTIVPTTSASPSSPAVPAGGVPARPQPQRMAAAGTPELAPSMTAPSRNRDATPGIASAVASPTVAVPVPPPSVPTPLPPPAGRQPEPRPTEREVAATASAAQAALPPPPAVPMATAAAPAPRSFPAEPAIVPRAVESQRPPAAPVVAAAAPGAAIEGPRSTPIIATAPAVRDVAATPTRTAPAPVPSVAPSRTESIAATPAAVPAPAAATLASADIDALIASFINAYESARPDLLAGAFDEDAETNLRRGRTAIRAEYEELFRLSSSRRMTLNSLQWTPDGDRARARGEMTVRIAWRDGREVEQTVSISMDVVARGGRAVIARLHHSVRK